MQTSDILRKSKKRKRKKRIGFVAICFFILSFFFLLSLFLANYHSFLINKIEITGNDVIKREEVSSSIEQVLADRIFFLYSKKNIFLFPEEQVLARLKTDFPRIEEVALSRNSDLMTVKIKERSAGAVFCHRQPSAEAEEKCYFTDENGMVFAEAPQFSGQVFYKIYGLVDDNPIGKIALVKDEFGRLLTLLKAIPEVIERSNFVG